MFNKFSRETDTRISKVRGSGLGLAIVKELVDLMQGTITVQSNPGGGTIIEVSIDVPYIIKDDLWSGQSGDSSDAESLCVGMHLLVAEDNELNYEVVSELLGMNGISCERAEDGSVCVAMFSTSAAGTYDGITVMAPYTNVSKTEIARHGARLGLNYAETYSCYKGEEKHCGKCGTCRERIEALHDAGIEDPTEYEE